MSEEENLSIEVHLEHEGKPIVLRFCPTNIAEALDVVTNQFPQWKKTILSMTILAAQKMDEPYKTLVTAVCVSRLAACVSELLGPGGTP